MRKQEVAMENKMKLSRKFAEARVCPETGIAENTKDCMDEKQAKEKKKIYRMITKKTKDGEKTTVKKKEATSKDKIDVKKSKGRIGKISTKKETKKSSKSISMDKDLDTPRTKKSVKTTIKQKVFRHKPTTLEKPAIKPTVPKTKESQDQQKKAQTKAQDKSQKSNLDKQTIQLEESKVRTEAGIKKNSKSAKPQKTKKDEQEKQKPRRKQAETHIKQFRRKRPQVTGKLNCVEPLTQPVENDSTESHTEFESFSEKSDLRELLVVHRIPSTRLLLPMTESNETVKRPPAERTSTLSCSSEKSLAGKKLKKMSATESSVGARAKSNQDKKNVRQSQIRKQDYFHKSKEQKGQLIEISAPQPLVSTRNAEGDTYRMFLSDDTSIEDFSDHDTSYDSDWDELYLASKNPVVNRVSFDRHSFSL